MENGNTFTLADMETNPTAAEPVEQTEKKTGAEPVTTTEEAATDPVEETEQETGEYSAAAAEKKRNPAQKRIDELTREKYEAAREADYWRGVAEGRIQQPAQETKQQQVEKPLPGLPPRPAFDEHYNGDYDAYVEDLAAWRFNKERISSELADSQRKETETARQAVDSHLSRVETVKAEKPDFTEVVNASTVQLRNEIVREVIASDQSAELVYYLAKNPDEADRLNSLPYNQMLREVGKLEVKVAPVKSDTPTLPPVRRVSQAPEPVKPVGSRETVNKNIDEMSMEEFAAHERERENKKQLRR